MKCGCDKKMEKELQAAGFQNPKLQGIIFDIDNGFKSVLTMDFKYNRINPKTLNYYRQDYHQQVKAKYCPFCGKKL